MSNRIQELADQARASIPAGTLGVDEWIVAYNQKFAELIIQDCMDVVDGYTKTRTFETHYDAVEQIEALFGVKHNGGEE